MALSEFLFLLVRAGAGLIDARNLELLHLLARFLQLLGRLDRAFEIERFLVLLVFVDRLLDLVLDAADLGCSIVHAGDDVLNRVLARVARAAGDQSAECQHTRNEQQLPHGSSPWPSRISRSFSSKWTAACGFL